MDTDLFQGVLLALLAIGLVVLIALLATLGGIRKALEQRAEADRAAAPTGTSGLEAEPADSATADTGAPDTATPDTATADTAAATAASDTPTPTAVASGGTPGQADTIRSVLEQHGLSQSAATPESTAATAATTPAAAEPVVDSVFASHADDPQEEPFQRDGRWWFRRGDELLLYNEGTGQWEPAPDQPAVASPTPVSTGTAEQSAVTQTTATTAEVPVAADQVSTFWKCPTCGAVNGSTAASCRMCFAPRP